ncbi:MAG TPA: hypothetical protein VKB08_03465 [Bradyrhizobium sp.]|nr:hypothetical protein [Bradyrhizobium sp.]
MHHTDQGLQTLFDELDHLRIQVDILKDTGMDPMRLFEMQRKMGLLDRRIAMHKAEDVA